MSEPRKKLTDILQQGADRERLEKGWRETEAAAEFAPLPVGEYTFRVVSGELFNSKRRGTPGYKLTLAVTEGEYQDRRAWVDFWLTPAALPMTKRDLGKVGVTDLEQLERPLPPGILIRGKLALRHDDDGNESNRLMRFECIGTEPGDAYEPPAEDQGDGKPPGANGTPTPPEADERQTGELFPFGANADGEADQRARDFLSREKGGRS
jgi:hypothetical protein